jgi:hypothetical protein
MISYSHSQKNFRSSVPGRAKDFNFSISYRPALTTNHLPIQLVPGALSSGIKRPEREADKSANSAEVKETLIYTSTPLHISWLSTWKIFLWYALHSLSVQFLFFLSPIKF